MKILHSFFVASGAFRTTRNCVQNLCYIINRTYREENVAKSPFCNLYPWFRVGSWLTGALSKLRKINEFQEFSRFEFCEKAEAP